MSESTPQKSNIKFIVIAMILLIFIGVFYSAIENAGSLERGSVNKDVPIFSMKTLSEEAAFLTSDDIVKNAPALVNVWASWCAPCRLEHPILTRLSKEHNIPIYGINYKDNPDNARRFLTEHGNPFVKSGSDEDGTLALVWGLRGVPETFVVNKSGKIVYKHQGELKEEDLETFMNVLKEAGFSL
ncbi:MAG: DsbE family thiol:disulfide interchange protein [Pseudomonadota bacterium]